MGFEKDCIKPYPIELIGGMLYQGSVAVLNLVSTNQIAVNKVKLFDGDLIFFGTGSKL